MKTSNANAATELLSNDVEHIRIKRNSKSWWLTRIWASCVGFCCRPKKYYARTVDIGQRCTGKKFPPNVIKNQKYNVITFLPWILYDQFRVFLNLCFLVMALSQFVPSLKIGYLYTYWAPLGFVLFVTICREAVDDIRRWKRDREVNSAQYTLLLPRQTGASIKMSIRKKQQFASVTRQPSFLRSSNAVCREIKSADIQVGDIIVVEKDQRVPADIVLLRTHEKNGSCFIRTDQLDGETDWKLRLAVPSTQNLESDQLLFQIKGQVQAEAPRQDIHSFEGTFHRQDASPTSITSLTRPIPEVISPNQATTSSSLQGNENPTYRPEPLTVDNILWSNTVVASGSVLGVVVYTGKETRAVMNSSPARSKSGLTDQEINRLTMLLTLTSVLMSFIMLSLKGFGGSFFKYFWRFFLLFSYIIPLALRVNLDLCKITYSFLIMRDRKLPGCIVRNTTIPEELGRLSYLMSDKTGTLTQNEMVFKKLHLGSISFGVDSMSEILQRVRSYFELSQNDRDEPSGSDAKKVRKTADQRIVEAVRALALCHNVTPMTEEKDNASTLNGGLVLDSISNHSDPDNDWDVSYDNNNAGAEGVMEPAERSQEITYQASSPDEIALVSWTETVGLTLIQRDLSSMQLRTPQNDILAYHILETFPFTSESKRMGIIVQASHPDTTQDDGEGEIVFYMKGADVVMSQIVTYTDWLDEETGNMAREGLRTLVVGKKVLTKEQYRDFADRYHQAKISLQDRQAKMTAVQTMLEEDLELVCLTGVEDKLQEGVRPTLETLRNAGIHVWMLTGDKLETAVCIAQSSRLVSRTQTIHIFKTVRSREDAHMELNAFRRHCESALIITGESIEVCLEFYEHEFIELACQCPSVVVCRCSPTQKALIVDLVRRHTQKRVAAIGDGGNDVSMIQAADVGIGLEGKEGRQASLASDFSLQQFKQIAPLLLVHGRNCYKNTSTLSQFIIHRGTIISVMQAIFSAVFYFAAVPLFPGLLMVGYPTLFTMFPVFSLILDRDVSDDVALRFPELYKELMKGRELNFKTFFVWLLISIYQGSILIYGALFLFEDDFVHIVTITFTALILTELLMVALTIQNWHIFMLLAELLSVVIYILALLILPNYFDQEFLKTVSFIWKTAAITGLSCIPLFILKFIRHKLRPPIYHKLQE